MNQTIAVTSTSYGDCSFVRLLAVEHIQILYLFEQTRKGIRMTRIRLKRERETLDAAGFAWSNPMYEARTLL